MMGASNLSKEVFDMTFGEKLARLRKAHGHTQEQLAGILGVSRQSVSKWESDLAYPETEKLIRLSSLYDCSLDYLMKDAPQAEAGPVQSQPVWQPPCYEYRSPRLVHGVPLVHVNLGLGRTARGIIAVGLVSRGVLSCGLVSVGLCSFGVLSLGLVSLGVLALGLLLAAGSIAVGLLAFGAICVGVVSVGALSMGAFSIGAAANGHYFALGDSAKGLVALGKSEAAGTLFQSLEPLTDRQRLEVLAILDEQVPFWLRWAQWLAAWFL